MAVAEGGRLHAALRQGKTGLPARPDGRRRVEEDSQILSAYAPGRTRRLRADRQQALRRLAGRAQNAQRRNRSTTKSTQAEYPDGPRTAQALYQAVYRQAVLTDMYAAEGNDNKSNAAHTHARELAARLKEHFGQSDYSWRAGALVYKLDEGIPVYGIDRE